MNASVSLHSFKKILIFTIGNPFAIGGVQRSMTFLCDSLIQDYQVTMCAWADSKDCDRKMMVYPVNDAVDVKFISRRLKQDPSEIKNIVDTFNPDLIIIINSTRHGLSILKILAEFDIPKIFSIRGSSEYCVKYLWPCKAALELAFWCADSVHVLMENYKKFFNADLQKKIHVIPSPIEAAKAYANVAEKNREGSFCVCYSGRLAFEKRVDLLINAFALVCDEFPDWKCVLYGNGPLEDQLRNLISELGLTSKVQIKNCNNTMEMYLEYSKIHLFVLPSEQEGCPMALREAMAHKIPVIGYAECSGTNEIIQDGVNGLLIENDDRVLRLSEAMKHLMRDGALRKKMGEAGFQTSLQYVPDLINSRWKDLIIHTLNMKSAENAPNAQEFAPDMLRKQCKALQLLKGIPWKMVSKIYKFNRNEQIYAQFKNEYLLLWGHRLFNVEFYLDQYPEVKLSGEDPLLHYISTGWKNGNNPSPFFDTNAYKARYLADDEEICPLVHYYLKGRFLQYHPIKLEQYSLKRENIEFGEFNYEDDLACEFKWR